MADHPPVEERLHHTTLILMQFGQELENYLDADTLFYGMGPSLPPLTIGGFLLRWHRLQAVEAQLSAEDQQRVQLAANQFNHLAHNRTVRLEHHALREINARLRQWQAAWEELQTTSFAPSYYATAAEARVMLHHLLQWLSEPAYQFPTEIAQRITQFDQSTQRRWQKGAFVWDPIWQAAYPPATFWYLYGAPIALSLDK